MLEDLLLIKKIREGDIGAFETLFRKYHPSLLYYSAGITNSLEEAEDIIQDLFYKFWKNREQINILVSVKSYLYKSVLNQSLQLIRRNHKVALYRSNFFYNEHSGNNPDAENHLQYNELENILSRCITAMPERRARIFKMHRYQNMKYKEIAQKLSLSVKTVEAEMTKALKKLKKEINISQQTL